MKRSGIFLIWMCNLALALVFLILGHRNESMAGLNAWRDGLSFYQASLPDGEWQWHSAGTLLLAIFVLYSGWLLRSLAPKNPWLTALALFWTVTALSVSALTYFPAERKNPIYVAKYYEKRADTTPQPQDSPRYVSDQIHTGCAHLGLWAFYLGGACLLTYATRSRREDLRRTQYLGGGFLIVSFALMFAYVMIPSPADGFVQRLAVLLGLAHVATALFNWKQLSDAVPFAPLPVEQLPALEEGSLRRDLILDGYRLIRPLGRGGFGEVWLCQCGGLGDYKALKFISVHQETKLDKEFEALRVYSQAVGHLHGAHLVTIHHVGKNAHGLYYVMPLADGYGHHDPCHESWQPFTLARLVENRKNHVMWFPAEFVVDVMLQMLEALSALKRCGLMHRDVKPENILFLKGKVCLADLSLLRHDNTSQYTRIGTTNFIAPAWYKGHPDMYGVSMTFYYLITGHTPETVGRSKFNFPKTDPNTVAASDIALWKFFHNHIIFRATSDNDDDRFEDFEEMAAVLKEGMDSIDRKNNLTLKVDEVELRKVDLTNAES